MVTLHRNSLVIWLAAGILLPGIYAVAAPALSIDQSLELKVPTAPQCSPDGRTVVYEQSRTNWTENAFETDLWVVDVATGASHPLTAPIKSSSNAAWSPDGKWIAFLSDRPGQTHWVARRQKAALSHSSRRW
jgi:dipeptidyl aminopeptidase/acylaminoacyl peptidase